MHRKLCLAILLPSTMTLAATAFAQTAWVEIGNDVTVPEFNETVDTIDDWDVFGPDGAEIGEVEDVLGVDAGAATALSVEFEDDAGFGDRDDVVVPLDQFTFADGKLTLNADAAAVATMDVYDDDDDD